MRVARLSDIIRRASSCVEKEEKRKGKEEEKEGISFREMASRGTLPRQETPETLSRGEPRGEPLEELPSPMPLPEWQLSSSQPATRPPVDERQPAEALYEAICHFIRESLDWKEEEKWAVERGLGVVHEVLESPQNIEMLYNWAIRPRDLYEFPVYHVANVFIFSLKIGMGLRYGKPQLEELGLVALLHDIGYGPISPEIRQAGRGLTLEEMREVRAHPVYGFELLLASWGEDYRPLAEIVLQTHERERTARDTLTS